MTGKGFPDYRWGAENSLLGKIGFKLAATQCGAALIRRLSPLDKAILTRSEGKFSILGPLGLSLLLLTTTGRKSGLPRTSPLIYLRDDDRILLAGSNFGQATHPAWTSNLLAEPRAAVTIGGQRIPVVATQLHGTEREEYYRRFESLGENYAAYRGRAHREIRVFALERAD